MSKHWKPSLSKVFRQASTPHIPGCHLLSSGASAGRSRKARRGPNGLRDCYGDQDCHLTVDKSMSQEGNDQDGARRHPNNEQASSTTATSSFGFSPPTGLPSCALLINSCCIVDLSDTFFSVGGDPCGSNSSGSCSNSSYSSSNSNSSFTQQWSRSSSSMCFPSYTVPMITSFSHSHPYPHAAVLDSHFVLPSMVDLIALDCADGNPDHEEGGRGMQRAAATKRPKKVATATAAPTPGAESSAAAVDADCGDAHGVGPRSGSGFCWGVSSGPYRQWQLGSHQRVYPEQDPERDPDSIISGD